uniref:GCR023 n=1 Tax=Schmidtea mediterranea TaxID=79327 RepID=A0A193KUF2_SCHMD|nr:GCR023 [Schmidtea mediterranea]
MEKYNLTEILQKIKSMQMIDFEVIIDFFGSKNESTHSACASSVRTWNMTGLYNLPPQCWPERYHPVTLIVLYVMLSILFLGTVIGNSLMIFAFFLVRRLRTPCNMLIINLAVTDLMVGTLVIPMASIYQIKGYWIFNDYICSGFILFDVLLCTSSILNLCAISVDRYFIITQPFRYATHRTTKRMLLMIFIVWAASALISVPPLFGWSNPKSKYYCDYSENLGYQIYATFIAFYLPLIVMLVLYGRIFRLANYIYVQEKMGGKETKQPKRNSNFRNNFNDNNNNNSIIDKSKFEKKLNNEESNKHLNVPDIKINFAESDEELHHNSKTKFSSGKRNNEAKAIKTLGVIMGCFTICWLPFFIFQLLNPVFSALGINSKTPVTEIFFQIFYWLGYTNSFLNPIIYAIFNREFRTPLKQIIKCRCRNIEDILRSENYFSQYGTSHLKSNKLIKDAETPITRRRSPQRIRNTSSTISKA